MPLVQDEDPNDIVAVHNFRTTAGVLAQMDLIVAHRNKGRKQKLSRNDLLALCVREGIASEWRDLGLEAPKDALRELERYQKNHSK